MAPSTCQAFPNFGENHTNTCEWKKLASVDGLSKPRARECRFRHPFSQPSAYGRHSQIAVWVDLECLMPGGGEACVCVRDIIYLHSLSNVVFFTVEPFIASPFPFLPRPKGTGKLIMSKAESALRVVVELCNARVTENMRSHKA